MADIVGSTNYELGLDVVDNGLLKTLQSVQKAMESLDKSVNSLATKMDKSFDSIGQSATKASSATSSSMKKVERAITPAIATLDRLQDKYAQVAKSSDKIGDATGNLSKVERAYQSYVSQVESGFSSTEKMTAATAALTREMTRAQQENQKYERAMNAVQKSVIAAESTVDNLSSRMQSLGASEKPVNQLTQALQRYKSEMTDAAGDAVATARAQANFADSVDRAKREVTDLNAALRRSQREMDSTHRSTGNLSASMGALIASTGAFVSAYNAIEILRMADQYTEMANRLAVVSSETTNVAEQMRTLLGVAIDARSSLDGITDVYSKLTRANERYGKSQEEILRITTAVSQSVSMSGATAQGAQGALIQFAQAISNNFQAAAQEINSINEQTPALAQSIALALTSTGKYGDVAVGDLKRLASEGRLSAGDLLDGFVNVADQIEARFNTATITMAQGFENFKDAAVASIGEVGRATGITKAIADTFQNLAKASEEASAAIAGVGAGLATLAGSIGVAGIVGLFAIMGTGATVIAGVGAALSVLIGVMAKNRAETALMEQAFQDQRESTEALRNSMFDLANEKYSWEDSSFGGWLKSSNEALVETREGIAELEADILRLANQDVSFFDQLLGNLGASIGLEWGSVADQVELTNLRTQRQLDLDEEVARKLQQAVVLAQRFNDVRFGNVTANMNEELATINNINDSQLAAIASVKSAAEDYFRFVTNNADAQLLDVRRAQIAEELLKDLGYEADNMATLIDTNKPVIDAALVMMAQGFADADTVLEYLNNNLNTNAQNTANSEEEIRRLYEGMDNAVGATARFSAEIARLGQIMMTAAAAGNTEMVGMIREIIIEMNKQYNATLKNINGEDEADNSRKRSEKSIDSLVNSYRDMNDVLQQQAALQSGGVESVIDLQALQAEEKAVRDIQKAIGELSSSELQKFVRQSGIVVKAGESVEDAMIRMTRETANFQDVLKEQEDANKNVTKGFEDLVKQYEEASVSLNALQQGNEQYERALASLEISREIDEITEAFNNLNAADQAKQLEYLAATFGLVGVNAENLPDKLRQVKEGIAEMNREAERQQEINEMAEKEAQRFEDVWLKGIENVAQTFKDGLFDMEDGFSGFADDLKSSFKNLLADLAYEAFLRPIVVGFQSDVKGMLGGQGGMSGGGFSNAIGAAKNLFSGGLGSIQWSGAGGAQAYGGTGFANAATSGTGATGFLGGSMQNFAGLQGLASAGTGMLGGMAGTKLGSSLFGKQANSNIGSTVGALGGTFLGGPIGAAIGGALGGAIDSLFGSKKTAPRFELATVESDTPGHGVFEDYGSGVVGRGAFGAVGFTDQGTARLEESFGGFDKAREFLEAIAATDNLLASIARSPDELEAMAKAVKSVRINTNDASKVADQLGKRTIAAVSAIDGEFGDFVATLGNDVEVIVARVQQASAAMSIMEDAAITLNLQFDASANGALRAADNMAQFAGGIDQLSALQESYYQSFFTDAERAANLQVELGKALNAMGMSLPSTREGFRQLVEQQNQMTESGQKNYVQLLQLSGAFDQLQQLIQSTGGAVTDFAQRLEDAKNVVSGAEDDVRDAFQTFIDQAFDIELGLLEVAGDEMGALALQREREIQSIDESLRPFQERLWALQDEKVAQEEAKKASEDYARSLASIQGELSNTLKSISQWVDAEMATGGSPVGNLSEATKQFEAQLAKAQGGDRTSLQNITQYADRLLQAGQGMFASGEGFQNIRDDVLQQLDKLPDALTAEEFLADEIKQALINQTRFINEALTDVLRGDNPSNIAKNLASYFEALTGGIDGVLTREQLDIVMNGKATDAELRAIVRAVDLNGDGVMDGLESVVIKGMPSDSILANVLRNKMEEVGSKQLTSDQVRSALSPIATDAEINKLLRTVDENGNGLITKQEVANIRLAGLATGIGNSLSPMFNMIDKSLDGVINYDEFRKSFEGMASDEELKKIFQAIDVNGDGTISRLEALGQSSDGTESNTDKIANDAQKQIRELNNLVGEMTQTTNQFVTLNSTMMSLRDSINALGVAQAEVARIEKERKAREIVEKGKLESSRLGRVMGDYNARLTSAKSSESQLSGLISNLQSKSKSSFGNNSTERKLFSDFSSASQAQINNAKDAVRKDSDGWINIAGGGRLRVERVLAVLSEVEKQQSISRDLSKAQRDLLQVQKELAQIRANRPPNSSSELESLRNQYSQLMGKPAPFAKGGAFTNSVVNTPTMFNMGMMGEAGPEAIMPLTRGPGGVLGVTNYSGSGEGLSGIIASSIVSSNNNLSDEIRLLRQDLNQRLDKNNEQNDESNAIDREAYLIMIERLKEVGISLSDMEDFMALQRSRD